MKNNHLLVKELKPEQKSKGGLYLPTPRYNREAVVLETYEDSGIGVGDIVLRNIGKGTAHKIDSENYEIININEIIAVIGNIKDRDATT